MPLSLLLVTPPAVEPIALADANTHLRVDVPDDDALITALIAAARQACEAFTGRTLITQAWRLFLDGPLLPRVVALPRPPILSVVAATVIADDATETIADPATYTVDTAGARLLLKQTSDWPAAVPRACAGLRIDFTAGYGPAATDVPAALRQGILQHIAQLYANRGDADAPALPAACAALYQPYRFLRLP